MDRSPAYVGYSAKYTRSRSIRSLPRSAYRFIKSKIIFDLALYPYAVYRHRQLLRHCDRTQSHTYTCFLRGPAQLRALAGPVMDFLDNPERKGERLEILLMACSIGAEAYTIASWLTTQVPGLDFHITASDLHQEMVDRAREGSYSENEALHSKYITPEFIAATFERAGDRYVVRDALRKKVTFHQANLLDGEQLRHLFAPAPIVIAQNVLFHLAPDDATNAFSNLVGLLAPRAVLLVEGMELDLRARLTKRHGLVPLDHDIRRIYEETRVHTPPDWWNYYWGTEPYSPLRQEANRYFGTIFLKGGQES